MLANKYKPKSWDEVVGQEQALAVLGRCRQSGGLGGHAFWLAASSGRGKTTIADLIAEEVAGDSWAINVYDDPSQLTGNELESIRRNQSYRPLGKGSAYICNEAHGFRRDQVRKLLGLTDTGRIPKWCVWCFTTTLEGNKTLFEGIDDASPLLSRCIVLPMRTSGAELAIALRVREIASAEGVEEDSIETYLSLYRTCKGNIRAMLGEIESGVLVS